MIKTKGKDDPDTKIETKFHRKSIQSRPRDGKIHIFRSDVHAKILRFFDNISMIRAAMGDVIFKIVPEASVFRGDADFDGPGAQKYHF